MVAALVLAACGSDDDDAGSTTPASVADSAAPASVDVTEPTASADSTASTEAAPPDTEASAVTEATDAAADVPSGGTLRWARPGISNLDPHKSTQAPDAQVLFLAYDRLVHRRRTPGRSPAGSPSRGSTATTG